jgi:peptidyl-prolyl cis-trans isomerase SurA
MKSFVFTAISILSSLGGVFATTTSPILMTINGKPVYKSEFEYIYNKNNANNSLEKHDIQDYVNLFVNFKLKVEEAKKQGLDTTKSFLSELSGYRTQLTTPYLTDKKVDESVLLEAYDRMKEDVDVSHILIRIPANATPADTLKAWTEITNILKRLPKEDFAKIAKSVSQDQSATENSGHIGWISAFRTVYPFETMAYKTAVGTISKPVRTGFGYHIIKVHARRKSLGEVLVSHIMRFTKNGDDEMNKKAKATIDSIYNRVVLGDNFGALATTLSQDKGSAAKNGELPWFGTGRMVPEFETAAFALKNTGDISKPIQTAYGWHILKLIDTKGLASFESMKDDIEKKVKRDERANLGKKSFLTKLKSDYNLQIIKPNVADFFKLLNPKTPAFDSTFLAEAKKLDKPLISFGDKSLSQQDFTTYLKKYNKIDKTDPTEIINEKINGFIDNELTNYEDAQLEKKHDEFRFLMQEYHDGILLFEVSNKEVWDKATKDTEGLDKYFKQHKVKYNWEKPHFKGKIIYCKNKEILKAAQLIIKKSDNDSVDKYLTTRLNDSIKNVKIEKGLFVQGENKEVDFQIFKTKEKSEPSKEYPFTIVIGKILKTEPEDYTDVRGLVTADYQEFLEQEWIKTLKSKYNVKIEGDILKTIKTN